MGNLNQVLIATCTDDYEAIAANQLLDRSLLYNRDHKDLNIVLGRQAVHLTKVDEENIVRNENNEIALKDDVIVKSITTRADDTDVAWRSQEKLCATNDGHTVVLLFKEDKSGYSHAFIGGEIIEVGDGIYGHYQLSLTSTGSRLLKGATTAHKKARLVLASYENEWYYGIKFMSNIPAKIYFAGWRNIADEIMAPACSEYEDSDMSEVIELDDDSDTGTQVVEYNDVNYEDKTWEFDTPLVTKYTHNKTANFTVAQSLNTSASGDYYEFSQGIRSYPDQIPSYEEYDVVKYSQNTTNGTFTIRGKDGYAWKITVDDDNATIHLRLKSLDKYGSRNIILYGSNADGSVNTSANLGTVSVARQEVKEINFEHIDHGVYWIFQADTRSMGVEYREVSVLQEAFMDANGWRNNNDNSGFIFGDGLKLVTSNDTSWIEESYPENTGLIKVDGTTSVRKPLMSLNISGDCLITVGFTTCDNNPATLKITETLDTTHPAWESATVSTSNSVETITDATYNFEGQLGVARTVHFLNEDASVKIFYVSVDYPERNQTEVVEDLVNNLEETGEDGTPHIIRLNGLIEKSTILHIADQIRDDSNRQFIIDLSQGTMEAQYVDWCADEDLSNAFVYCVGLRSFYYPKNVTTSGNSTFMYCSFLREVHFNKEMQYIGSTGWHSEYYGVFAGSRLKTLFLPASIKGFRGYSLSESNIIKVYVEKGSQLPASIATSDAWCEWFKVKKGLKFIMPEPEYSRYNSSYNTFGAYGYPNGGQYKETDESKFIGKDELIRDHLVLWENYDVLEDPETSIDYTA